MTDFIKAGSLPTESRAHHVRREEQISYKLRDKRDERIRLAKERVRQQREANQEGAQ